MSNSHSPPWSECSGWWCRKCPPRSVQPLQRPSKSKVDRNSLKIYSGMKDIFKKNCQTLKQGHWRTWVRNNVLRLFVCCVFALGESCLFVFLLLLFVCCASCVCCVRCISCPELHLWFNSSQKWSPLFPVFFKACVPYEKHFFLIKQWALINQRYDKESY